MTIGADEVIARLGLQAHPEGGWFREVWREPAVTAIYYLLRAGERSAWHRVDATEMWHFYAGAALELAMCAADGPVTRHVLGADLSVREGPLQVVPAGVWQSARPLGAWVLAGCTVSPAFEFSRFQLAPPGWDPGR